jgi:hypothetical protein
MRKDARFRLVEVLAENAGRRWKRVAELSAVPTRSNLGLFHSEISDGFVSKPQWSWASAFNDVGHSYYRTQFVACPVKAINAMLVATKVVPVSSDETITVVYPVRVVFGRASVRRVILFNSVAHGTASVSVRSLN